MSKKRILIIVSGLLLVVILITGIGFSQLFKQKEQKQVYIVNSTDKTDYTTQDTTSLSSEQSKFIEICSGMKVLSVNVDVDKTDMKSILEKLVADYMQPVAYNGKVDVYDSERFTELKILNYEKKDSVGYIDLIDKKGYLNGGSMRVNSYRCMFIETVKKNDPSVTEVKFQTNGKDVDYSSYYLFQP